MAEAPLPLDMPDNGALVIAGFPMPSSENSAASVDNADLDMDHSNSGGGVGMNLRCPATPQLPWKHPDGTSSSSDSDSEERQLNEALNAAAGVETAGRAASPPPNCAICLGRCKNKCFTDSCMHQFCFKCLCEWSKVKPECPLCKQTFKSIIHNVKSMDQFEEYHVQPPTVQIPNRTMEVSYGPLPYVVDGVVVNGGRRTSYEVSLPNWHQPRNAPPRFMRVGRIQSFSTTDPAGGERTINLQNQFLQRNQLLEMYRQENPDAPITSGTLSQLWRRYVYDRKLYALPVCDVSGRFRESSARFYRENPAQLHRIMPWINRDLICLLRNGTQDISSIFERISQSLVILNIHSPSFRRRLQPILGSKTNHFIHELNNFARSPYDMIGYDRAVQYSANSADQVVIDFTSSSSDDDDDDDDDRPVDIQLTAQVERGNNQYRVQSRAITTPSSVADNGEPLVNMLSFTISTTSEGSEAPGVTVEVTGSRGAQNTAINLTTHNRASNEFVIDLDEAEAEINRQEIAAARAHVSAQSSSLQGDATFYTGPGENAVRITATVTSPTETFVVSDNRATSIPATAVGPPSATATSASQTVQRPTPVITGNIELSSTSSDECEFVLERKAPHLRTPELVSLNSESDSDVVFVDETKHLSLPPKANDKDKDVDVKDPHLCAGLVTSDRPQTRLMTRNNDELYNVGPSTSAGLRSGSQQLRSHSIETEQYNTRSRQRLRRSVRNRQTTLRGSRKQSDNGDDTASSNSVSNFSQSSTDSEDDSGNKKKRYSLRRVTRSTKRVSDSKISAKRKHIKESGKCGKRSRRNAGSSVTQGSSEDESLSLTLLKKRLRLIADEQAREQSLPIATGEISMSPDRDCEAQQIVRPPNPSGTLNGYADNCASREYDGGETSLKQEDESVHEDEDTANTIEDQAAGDENNSEQVGTSNSQVSPNEIGYVFFTQNFSSDSSTSTQLFSSLSSATSSFCTVPNITLANRQLASADDTEESTLEHKPQIYNQNVPDVIHGIPAVGLRASAPTEHQVIGEIELPSSVPPWIESPMSPPTPGSRASATSPSSTWAIASSEIAAAAARATQEANLCPATLSHTEDDDDGDYIDCFNTMQPLDGTVALPPEADSTMLTADFTMPAADFTMPPADSTLLASQCDSTMPAAAPHNNGELLSAAVDYYSDSNSSGSSSSNSSSGSASTSDDD